MGTLDGRTIVITGAASGMGAATARHAYREGASVVVADLDAEALDVLAAEPDDSSRMLAVRTDVTSPSDVEALFEATVATYGVPHGLVNSAGITCIGSLLDVEADAWSRVMAVNVEGTLYASRAFARRVLDAGAQGAIVNFSSGAGLRGVANRIGYVASKFAVTGMTYTMALELSARGIRVNAVAPGVIRTPFMAYMLTDDEAIARVGAAHPIGRLGEADEVASTVVFLLGDGARFITGAVLPVDGGNTAGLPSLTPPLDPNRPGATARPGPTRQAKADG